MSLRAWIGAIISACWMIFPVAAGAFSVAPGALDVAGDAGTVVQTKMTAINTGDAPETYYFRTVPFTTREDQTGPLFGVADATGAASWVEVPRMIEVPAYGRKTIPLAVHVPSGTKAGGYYAAILASTSPADVVAAAGAASLQANIATLLFISVGGSGLEKMALLDAVSTGPAVRDGLWGTFTYRLQNQGNVHVMPAGTVRVQDVFGRPLVEAKLNEEHLRLMPGNTRLFSGTFPEARHTSFVQAVQDQWAHFALGPVRANLFVTPGLTPETPLHTSFLFWVIPWQFILTILVVVGCVYGMAKAIRARFRR